MQQRVHPSILDTYNDERLPVIEDVLSNTRQMTAAIEAENPLIKVVRNVAIQITSELPSAQRLLRLQFSGSQRPLGSSSLFDERSLSFTSRLQQARTNLHPNPLDDISFGRGPKPAHRAVDSESIVKNGNAAQLRLFEISSHEPEPFRYRLLFG